MLDLHQKKLLCVAFGINFLAGIAFFGTFSTLILFLVKSGVEHKIAYGVWQNYDVLIYVVSLLGGIVVSRMMSFRLACLIGMILACAGYFFLAFNAQASIAFINLGLAFVSCGAGLFSANIKNIVAVSLEQRLHRYNGFSILHMADILGQISGPLLLTSVGLYSKNLMFLVAGIFVLIALVCFSLYYSRIKVNAPENSLRKTGLLLMGGLLLFVIMVMHWNYAGYVLALAGIGILGFLAHFFYRSSSLDCSKVMGLVCLMFGMLVASVCFRQVASVLNLFTDTYVDRVAFGLTIPAGYFQSLEPLFVFMLVPFFLWLWSKLEKFHKTLSMGTGFSIGLLLLAISFSGLFAGFFFSGNTSHIAIGWLIFCYAFMAAAELFIIPVGLAAVAELSPEKWRGFFMGIWLLLAAIGTYLNGFIGKTLSPVSGGSPSFAEYHELFMYMTYFALVSAIVLWIIWKLWQKRDSQLTLNESHRVERTLDENLKP